MVVDVALADGLGVLEAADDGDAAGELAAGVLAGGAGGGPAGVEAGGSGSGTTEPVPESVSGSAHTAGLTVKRESPKIAHIAPKATRVHP